MSEEKQRPTANLLHFSPQNWGEVERFTNFWNTTYEFDRITQKRLRGIVGHFNKAGYLFQLCKKLADGLDIDEQQMKEIGYSPAHNSKELAAVVESAFCELYTVLDCCRAVLLGVYPNHQGIKKSTRGTFQKAHKGELDPKIPAPVRDALKSTEPWFLPLRKLRDEITHSNVGSCHKHSETGEVFYMHQGLGSPGKSLVIEKVFDEIELYFKKV